MNIPYDVSANKSRTAHAEVRQLFIGATTEQLNVRQVKVHLFINLFEISLYLDSVLELDGYTSEIDGSSWLSLIICVS